MTWYTAAIGAVYDSTLEVLYGNTSLTLVIVHGKPIPRRTTVDNPKTGQLQHAAKKRLKLMVFKI
jgi:hypothetical protein